MKIKYTILVSFFVIRLIGFGQTSSPSVISNPEKEAECVFLTKDNHENPVIAWAEGEKGQTQLYYSISKNQGKSFETPIEVTSSKGLSAHHESMAKVAFKKTFNNFTIIKFTLKFFHHLIIIFEVFTLKFLMNFNWEPLERVEPIEHHFFIFHIHPVSI